jgi:hypothetical protein
MKHGQWILLDEINLAPPQVRHVSLLLQGDAYSMFKVYGCVLQRICIMYSVVKAMFVITVSEM